MRFAFLLAFALHTFKFGTMDYLNPCLAKEYKKLDESEVKKNFASEYSIFSDGHFSKKERDNMNQLCACAIFKINEMSKMGGENANFETILKNVSVLPYKDFMFPLGYCFQSPQRFPSFTCKRRDDDEKYIIIKGPRNQSTIGRREYNIYIASYRDKIQDYHFKGIIEKVDVEMPANERRGIVSQIGDVPKSWVRLHNAWRKLQNVVSNTQPIIINATEKHTASVIFLHGIGLTGKDCVSDMKLIRVGLPHMRVICPTAESLPLFFIRGMKIPAWFNIYGLDRDSYEDKSGIEKATDFVHSLIEKEIKAGIRSDRIIIGGFSQGAALALRAALLFDKKLAGVFALSGWFPLHREFSPSQVTANKDIHILQYHGKHDDIVSYEYAQMTNSLLNEITKNCEFITRSNVGHDIFVKDMEDVGKFLRSRIPAN